MTTNTRTVADVQNDMRRARAEGNDEWYARLCLEKIELLKRQARGTNGRTKIRTIHTK